MYARSTTYYGDPMRTDAGTAYVRDTAMPAIKKMAGSIGLSMLCDRDTGRCIVTTAWRDEMSMHDSEGAVWDMRRQVEELLGGHSDVQEWEIALVHRMHEAHNGACTRVIYGSMGIDELDDGVSAMRMSLLDRLEDLPGFCAINHMIDRETGRSATAVTYDSRADMMAATEQAQALRYEFASSVGMEIIGVAEFDLVLAHLRVPELT